MNPGRNDPCPCGSGLKYKKCCGGITTLSTTTVQRSTVSRSSAKAATAPMMVSTGKVLPEDTAQQRSCGDCSACCEGWLNTRVLGNNISLHKPCPFSSGHNCTIHETRPHDPCRVFFCGWAEAGSDLPEWMQPNQSGVIMLTGRSSWRGRPLDVVVSAGRDPNQQILSWLQQRSIEKMHPFVYQIDERWYGFGPSEFQQEMAAKAARGEPLWT